MTLRARLTLVYGGMFFVAGALLLGLTYALFHQELDSKSGPIDLKVRTEQPEAAQPVGPPSVDGDTRVTTQDGDVLWGPDAAAWLEGERAALQDSASTSLLVQGGIALGLVGTAATGLGWLIAGRTLAPIHRVTETARRIGSAPAADRGLHERIALRGPPDEVKELADTFDAMIERLDKSFDGQRRFVANASHELRTPLTVGRSLVEVAMHRSSASEDVRRLGENLLVVNERHERLIEGLLLLATSENELPERRLVDLREVVDQVVRLTSTEAEQSATMLRRDLVDAPVSGDALLMERVVLNLVENGIRHNSGERRWVRVSTRVVDGRVELEVANTGPTVPAYEIPELLEPFRRRTAERLATGRGTGLGLSIVRAVVRTHGGQIRAEPRAGGGLVVTVTLPVRVEGPGEAVVPAGGTV